VKYFCILLFIALLLTPFTDQLYGESNRERSELNRHLNTRQLQEDRKTPRTFFNSKRIGPLTSGSKYGHLKQVVSNRDVIDIKVNGEDQTSVQQGEEIVVTVYFSDDSFEAYVEIWSDMNNNGIWEEEIDLPLPDSGESITDNDPEDEDPATGVYQVTVEAEDGPTSVSNLGFFFLAQDEGGFDEAFVYINPNTSEYSVSGTV